ncbi:hypothetical protein Hanom_Chr02g00136581 [Helianthus anomalus]
MYTYLVTHLGWKLWYKAHIGFIMSRHIHLDVTSYEALNVYYSYVKLLSENI